VSFRSEIRSIYDEAGYLTPGLVVEKTADQTQFPILHEEIHQIAPGQMVKEWKLRRSRELIRMCEVIRTDGNGQVKPYREYLSIARSNPQESESRSYRHVDDIIVDPALVTLTKREMERDWKAFYNKWRKFEWFWGHFDEIREE